MRKLSDLINVFEISSYVSEIKRNLGLSLSCERYVICIESVILFAWIENLLFESFILVFQSFNLLQTSFVFMLEIDIAL